MTTLNKAELTGLYNIKQKLATSLFFVFTIPHICPFWYTTALFTHVTGSGGRDYENELCFFCYSTQYLSLHGLLKFLNDPDWCYRHSSSIAVKALNPWVRCVFNNDFNFSFGDLQKLWECHNFAPGASNVGWSIAQWKWRLVCWIHRDRNERLEQGSLPSRKGNDWTTLTVFKLHVSSFSQSIPLLHFYVNKVYFISFHLNTIR